MVFAWKNDHRFAASILRLSASVWALLPRVSENASSVASIEMSNATFLLAGSRCAAPDIVPLLVELRRALFYSKAFLDGTSFAASNNVSGTSHCMRAAQRVRVAQEKTRWRRRSIRTALRHRPWRRASI